MDNVCETCNAKQLAKDYWELSSGVRDANFLYTRVCQYAIQRNKPCANSQGKVDESKGWKNLDNF